MFVPDMKSRLVSRDADVRATVAAAVKYMLIGGDKSDINDMSGVVGGVMPLMRDDSLVREG